MTNPDDDFLKKAFEQDKIQAYKAGRDIAYEENIVKRVLASCKLENQAGVLANKAREATGKARLTFAWFYETYSTYPVRFLPKKLGWVFQIKVPELFDNFSKSKLYDNWLEAYDLYYSDNNWVAGLIFDWPGIKTTQMILHNGDEPYNEQDQCISFFVAPDTKLFLERLRPVLASISEHWSP